MKSGTSFIRVIVIILSVLAIFYGLVFLGLSSFTRFQVHENLSYEQKASNARAALMPDVAGYVERYGLRGFQDVDCQVETVKFDSIDNLVAAIPSLECYKSSAASEGTDIKGKKAKIYEIDRVRPCEGRRSVLPLDFSHVDKNSQEEYWIWKYSIYEYKDGSCRFVMLISPI